MWTLLFLAILGSFPIAYILGKNEEEARSSLAQRFPGVNDGPSRRSQIAEAQIAVWEAERRRRSLRCQGGRLDKCPVKQGDLK